MNYNSYDPGLLKCLCVAQTQILKLENKLRNKSLKEDALQRCWEENGVSMCAATKSGRCVKIAEFTIEEAAHVDFDPIYFRQPEYVIRLNVRDSALCLSEADYFNDRRFLTLLQNFSGREVLTYGSVRQTAALIRQVMAKKLKPGRVLFFGGWLQEEQRWHFVVSEGFCTHAIGESTVRWNGLQKVGIGATSMAAEGFIKTLSTIRDPDLRSMLCLLLHAGFLSSILSGLGWELPQKLYLYSRKPAIRGFLTKLLSFYGDPVVDLECTPTEFSRALAERKDQILVILDRHQSMSTKNNTPVLQTALETGTVTLRKNRDELVQSLQSLIVIISGASSVISCSPSCILWDISDDAIDMADCATYAGAPFNWEYWSAFASYVESNAELLNRELKNGEEHAYRQSENHMLSDGCLKTFGVLWGIRNFLLKYFRALQIDISTILAETWEDTFLRLAEESTEQHECLDGIADIFIEAAKDMLRERRFRCFPKGKTATGHVEEGIVYFDDEFVFLDGRALEAVCLRCSCSRPYAIKALAEAGYLGGKPVNSTTHKTRIQSYDAFGRVKKTPVFRFDRKLFENFGEPTLFCEENESSWISR